ncbi:MAG: hypothetical protein WAK22_17395 [Candidatus Sulfotelmatobacter sp.]
MLRNMGTLVLALVLARASTVLASAQAVSSPADNSPQSGSSPAAFIYVVSTPASGKNQITGYAAASNGALSTIPGTPFSTAINDVALNSAWLFGTDGKNIDSFSIAPNGSLKPVDTLAVEPDGGLGSLFLDHTGSSLYADYYTTNNEELAYSIDNSTGKLTYLDNIMAGPGFGYVESFIGNDQYAYESTCYHFTPSIYGIQRSSDGAITMLDVNPPYPTAPSGDSYCPWSAAADPANHLAIAMQPLNSDFIPVGPYQLATYTVDSAGQLSTTSTSENMPTTEAGGQAGNSSSQVIDYWMSPSGKFLAVAGTSGLQVFHFNGADPITKYTGLLVSGEVDQVFWDNSNHLYAIGNTAGKLWVFTVTATGVTQAPGSPHSITSPGDMIVLPK